MNLLIRLTHGVFWSFLGTAGARFFSLAASLAAARLLGRETFGALSMVQSTLGFLGVFASFSLGLTATKYVAELKDRDPVQSGRLIALSQLAALVTGSAVTVALVLAAPWLARHTLNAPPLAFMLQLGAPILLISALLGVQTGCLAGFQDFRTIARINLYQGLLSLPLTFILIYRFGMAGAVLSLVLAAFIHLLLSSWALGRACRAWGLTPDYRRCLSEQRTLWRFSLPAVLAGSMLSPVTWAAHAILVQQPGGYAELGLFYAASKLQVLIMFASNAVSLVTGPLLAEIHGSRDRERFARASNLNLKAAWSLALPGGFLLIGLSPWLMALFGPAFQEGRLIPAVLICVAVLNLVNDTVGQTLISSGRMWAGFVLYLAWGLTLLAGAWLLVPALGAAGLALAYFLAYAGHAGWALFYTRRRFGRESVAHAAGLATLTGVMFLLALNIGSLPDAMLLSLAILGAAFCVAWGWRLLPTDGRRQLLAVAGMKG